MYKLVNFKYFKSITDQSLKSRNIFYYLCIQIFPQAYSAIPRHTPNAQICSHYFSSFVSTFPQIFLFHFSPNIQREMIRKQLVFCLRLRKKSDERTMIFLYAGISCSRFTFFFLTGKWEAWRIPYILYKYSDYQRVAPSDLFMDVFLTEIWANMIILWDFPCWFLRWSFMFGSLSFLLYCLSVFTSEWLICKKWGKYVKICQMCVAWQI